MAALALGTLFGLAGARATPFLPLDDAAVIERLPDATDPAARVQRRLHADLAADPGNLELATRVARGDIDRARAQGDPRWFGRAQAALAPWLATADAPNSVLLLRAIMLQSSHDFQASLATLRQVIARDPRNGQAWLIRASVRQVGADYPGAFADCGQFATMTLGLAPDTCTASLMSVTGHAALALRALSLSLGQYPDAPAPVRLWAMTSAAEIAARLDDASAEGRFRQALALQPTDPYLLGAWSDWLLDHDRAAEIVPMLREFTRQDPLLLRLALAERAIGSVEADGRIPDLAVRFNASRLRGETIHRREEARFRLHLLHQGEQGLALAQANWEVQREPADARILLEAAIATGRPEAAAPVLAWMRDNAVEDRVLEGLAGRLRAPASAKEL